MSGISPASVPAAVPAAVPFPVPAVKGGWAERSELFRRDILCHSGGWLYDLVVLISCFTGLWDLLILAAIFVIAWTTLRTSDSLMSLILARVFDLSIPLQHQLSDNPTVQSLHAPHFNPYWRLFAIGLALELASCALLHPDLVTLVACTKTAVLTAAWLGRYPDGTFWLSETPPPTLPVPVAATYPAAPPPAPPGPSPPSDPPAPTASTTRHTIPSPELETHRTFLSSTYTPDAVAELLHKLRYYDTPAKRASKVRAWAALKGEHREGMERKLVKRAKDRRRGDEGRQRRERRG